MLQDGERSALERWVSEERGWGPSHILASAGWILVDIGYGEFLHAGFVFPASHLMQYSVCRHSHGWCC